ncbi:MAG: heparan-alpha-glucosaminide N-acetyltransferase [Bacillota bacterium]
MIKQKSTGINRIWEIDLLRGILIITMIVLHALYDLEFFYNVPIGYSTGMVNIIRVMDATSFILVSGISTSFSRSSFKRGLLVISAALSITLVSYMFNNDYFIVFGILHLMGICMISSPLLKKLPAMWLFVISFILASTNFIIPHINVTNNYFFMFGLHNSNFASSDYYPLLPWAWAFVFGVALSKLIYKERKSIFNYTIKDNPVSFLGRNSLWVYIIHQPVVLLLLSVFMK